MPDEAPASGDAIDPLIHVPARLRLMVTLAGLPEGDIVSFTRLQDMLGLTPGNLITHLRKLEDAGYLRTEKTGSGAASRTSVALTRHGRTALQLYSEALRDILAGLQAEDSAHGTQAPGLIGTAMTARARPPARPARSLAGQPRPACSRLRWPS